MSGPLSPGFGLSLAMKTVSFRVNFLGTLGLRASTWGLLQNGRNGLSAAINAVLGRRSYSFRFLFIFILKLMGGGKEACPFIMVD